MLVNYHTVLPTWLITLKIELVEIQGSLKLSVGQIANSDTVIDSLLEIKNIAQNREAAVSWYAPGGMNLSKATGFNGFDRILSTTSNLTKRLISHFHDELCKFNRMSKNKKCNELKFIADTEFAAKKVNLK